MLERGRRGETLALAHRYSIIRAASHQGADPVSQPWWKRARIMRQYLMIKIKISTPASSKGIVYDPLTSSLIAGSVYVLLHFLTRVLITRNRLAIFFMCFWDPSNTNMWLFALPSSDSSDSTGSSSNSKRMYQSLYSSIALLQDDQGAARGPQYKTFNDAQGSSCYLFL